MDPQHRHELEQNDLAEFIAHSREWAAKNGLHTLLLILVIVLGFVAWNVYKDRKEDRRNEQWRELDDATSPDAYHALAQLYDDPGYTSLAHLRAADTALRKIVGGDNPLAAYGIPSQEEPLSDEDKADLLDTAEQDYNAVLKMPDAPKLVKLNAMLGLAAVYETRENWDDARQQYQQVIDTAGEGYDAIIDVAKARQAALDRAAVPVRFAPEPPPVEPPAAATDVPMIPAGPIGEGASTEAAPADSTPAETPAADNGNGE